MPKTDNANGHLLFFFAVGAAAIETLLVNDAEMRATEEGALFILLIGGCAALLTVLAVRNFGGSVGAQVGLALGAVFALVNIVVILMAWLSYTFREADSGTESDKATPDDSEPENESITPTEEPESVPAEAPALAPAPPLPLTHKLTVVTRFSNTQDLKRFSAEIHGKIIDLDGNIEEWSVE